MKFSKNIFCKLFVACVGVVSWTDFAVGVYCNDSNHLAPAGTYCYGNVVYNCDYNCYCEGGKNQAWGFLNCDKDARKIKFGAHVASAGDNGVYLCPETFPQSSGGSSEEDCYKWCANTGQVIYNKYVACPAGHYLPAGRQEIEPCLAGYKCPGASGYNGSFLPTCDGDNIKIKCGVGEGKELEYAPAGASACSTCDVDGKAVVKNGELHVGCEACVAGKYTLDHQNCLDCSIGYFCQGGIQNKCTGNTYSDVQGLADCKVCSGDKMGVKYTTTTVNDQTETLQTGCGICPNGKYGNDGVCEPCPAGYRCLNGEKIICAKGYYSAAGATSCTHCPNFFTTEGPGTAWTPGANVPCTVAQIYLKDANTSGNGIMFPACLNRGDINERILRSN